MQCLSCSTEIPPAWVACIQKNICPACGKAILDETTKQLMDELRDAISKMSNDPEGLSGWILSNYHLKKKGTVEPTEFYGKAKQVVSNEGDKKLVIAESSVQKFMKAAGADKILQNPKLAAAQQAALKLNNSLDLYANLDANIEEPALSKEEAEEIAAEEAEANERSVAAAIAKAKAAGRKVSVKDLLVNSDVSLEGEEGSLLPGEDQKLKQMFGGEEDTNLHPALQVERMKRLQKQVELSSGGGRGGFRRNG